MSLTADQLQFLLDRGMTLADAIEFARLNTPEKPISKGAERTRRWRANKAEASLGDVTVTRLCDVSHVQAGAQVVTPFSSSLRSEEVGGGVGACERGSNIPLDDWPDGKASDHAQLLVEAVASPWLDPHKSPDLVTTRGRVAAWKRDGASWEHDVLAVVTGLCANRRSRVASWKFFDDAISRSIAENRAALEIPEAAGRRQTGPPHSISAQIATDNAESRRLAFEMMDAQDGPKN